MKNFGKNFMIRKTEILLLLITAAFVFSCSKSDESKIQIERFEYLDHYKSNTLKDDNLDDRLLSKAYLIHGYKRKRDKEVHDIVDKYFCDSLIQDIIFHNIKIVTFYKKSKITNMENFQTRPKHKKIYARSNDKLFSYILTYHKDSTLFRIRKNRYGLTKPDPPSEPFDCH